ncbi:calmodulin-binding protein 60 B-like [Eucalyptus grandis]|uniref:calmodulin-binding protein 60 B-like n=1 Tax=Eucalyptus grandis TaxID=71139 RepID=UPI00192EF34C|nr:calmodulin-binding protein 60 B-like [Eucalyptus grandis]
MAKSHWRNMNGGLLPGEFASFIEPLFRKVVCYASQSLAVLLEKDSSPVSEEVERVISSFHDPPLRAPSNPVGTSEESSLRLQFVTKLPTTIFADSQIEAEDGTPLRIEVVDGRTNERVTSGPLSSIKLQIVILDGDFGSDEGEDWTEQEFNSNIVHEREGKRPLITGVLNVTLQGGIGSLRNLIITDNSSWMKSRKFRLGAQAAQKVSTEMRIREARSEPFVVKDRRAEYLKIDKFSLLSAVNKKHHPPSLSDEVWRLQKIAKHGPLHKCMSSRSINTVQDFLQLHEVDASSLRNILGTRITNRTWETIVRHASTCVVDDNKMYAYYQDLNKSSILFNSVMKVTQATLDGQTYQSVDKLTHSQKILVQNLRRQAYHSKNQWVPLDSLPSITPSRALANLPIEPLIGPNPPLHHPDYTVLNQDRPEVTPECNYSQASTPHCYNVTGKRKLDCLGLESHIIAKILDPTVAKSSARQDVSSGCSAGKSSHHPGYSQGPFALEFHSSPEDLYQVPSLIPGNFC